MGAIVSLPPVHHHGIVCLISQEVRSQMDTVFKELLNRQGLQDPPLSSSSSSSSSAVPATSSQSAQSQAKKKKA